jgi:hypothetical protein
MEKELTKQDNINSLLEKLNHGKAQVVAEAVASKIGGKPNAGSIFSNWFSRNNVPKKHQDTVIDILQIFINSQDQVKKDVDNYPVVFEEVKTDK